MTVHIKVEDIMTKTPVLLTEHQDIGEAVKIFSERDIAGAVVVDENKKPIGYLSEMDCLQSYISGVYNEQSSFGHVGDFMSDKLDALNPKDDYLAAARKFIETRRRKFPVIDDLGNVVGSLNRHQLVRAIEQKGWEVHYS